MVMATATHATRPRTVVHLTVEERVARGKAARAEVPRSRHGEYEAPGDRADPVDLLEAQAQTRVPELVPIRYGRMLVSPFTFYRGAAKIMADDLAGTPRSGLTVQCCGDAHLSNFGVFGSPERRLVFDINDFDETLPGPWEWDVKRLAASMLIAARDNGYGAKDQERVVLDTVREYRETMRTFAGMENLAVWYAHMEIEPVLREYASQFKRAQVKRTEATLAKAHTRDSMAAFSKLTQRVNGRVEIVDQSPLIVPLARAHAGAGRERVVRGAAQADPALPPVARVSTGACCSRSFSWRTSRGRSWAWAAWAPGRGSRCSSAETVRIPCSCR